ncbi:transposase [Gemella morbillorum]|uniref:transposase n=1 Tax=Gemella morbillorum TaxID=29391 RepID=UPI0023F4EF0C|nr:transposase [Gemella morbillorum]
MSRIIIDRFHIIQNINRELNKERVRLMNIYRGKKGKEGRNYTITKELLEISIS